MSVDDLHTCACQCVCMYVCVRECTVTALRKISPSFDKDGEGQGIRL